MKHIFSLIILIGFTSALNAQDWKTQIGQKSPAFEITGKNGKTLTSADLKGKVVLVNFFATWCPPCRAELPRVQKEIWEKYGQKEDFEVVVLAREEGWDKLDPFIKEHSYTFPFYPDLKRAVFSLFADSSIPRNVILNKEGNIIYQSIGYSEQEFSEMVKLIDNQLSE